MVPMIPGTPMISHIMNVIKEMEIDALAMPWVNTWVAYLLVVQWAMATGEDDKGAAGKPDPSEYDEVVTKNAKMIDAYSSQVIHVKTGTAYIGVGLNVMTQVLHAEDGSLPQGLTIQNASTEMHNGSKDVTIVVRNSTAYPQTLRKRTLVVRAVAAIWVPEPLMQTSKTETLDRVQGLQMPKLTMKQRQEKIVWRVRFDWVGILATQVGGFCPISLGWIPWHLLLRAQWTWLFSFN